MRVARFPFGNWVAMILLSLTKCSLSYDENVCIPPTETCGPIAPSPPHSYVSHIEVVDKLYETTTYTNEFYDPEREAMAVIRTSRGAVAHVIFFYETDTAVIMEMLEGTEDSKPLASCVVDVIEDAAPWLIGTDKNGTYGFMLAPSQALFFGGDYKYGYVDSDPVREIPCNRWDSCIETYGNGTMAVRYHWTDPTHVYDTTGYGKERPVLANVSGYYHSPRSSQVNVETAFNFGLFDENPVWDEHRWAFEIPSTMYCPGLPSGKSAPMKIADTYSMRVEVTVETSFSKGKEFVSMAKNWYDYDRKITRADFIPDPLTVEGYYVGFSEAAVIRDFRSGVEYIIDKGLGNCTTIPIPDSGYDTIVDPSGQITIKDPLTLFGLGQVSNLTYYGKKQARGLPCDVWTGTLKQQIVNTTLEEELMYEIYFLEEGWHEDSGAEPLPDEIYPIPILIKIQQAFISSTNPNYDGIIALEQNIFKFDQADLDMSVFDVTSCFHGHDQIRRFQVAFPGEFRDDFDNKPKQFIQSITWTLETYFKIPGIRIQHMAVEFDEQDGRLYCEFSLLDRPPLGGVDWPDTVGPPLNTVVGELEDSMENFFVILFDESYDTPGHMKKMKAYEDSLHEMFEDSCHPLKSQPKSPRKPRQQEGVRPEENQGLLNLPENLPKQTDTHIYEPEKPASRETGESETSDLPRMSLLEKLQSEFTRFASYNKVTRSSPMYGPGDMAGMGIGMFLVGFVLGIAAMMATLRKFGLTSGMEFIPMSSRRS